MINRERVCYDPNASFASFVRGWPRIICSYHLHEEYELTCVESSEGSLLAGDYVGAFAPGDVFFLGANLPHLFRNWPGMRYGRAGARTHVIQFRKDFLGADFFKSPELKSINRLLLASTCGFRLEGKLRARISTEMSKLHEAKGPVRVIRLLEILRAMASQPSRLSPLSSLPAASTLGPVDARLERVLNYIYENIGNRVSFEHVVRLSCMTPSAFSRYFRRQTTLSFTEFLNRLRICHACRLLTTSDMPVTEIALSSGYENLSYFNRQFKFLTSLTPLAFRRSVLE